MGFKDVFTVTLIGGKGGDGCVSFLREAFRPRGPANGGSGGRGGSVYVMPSRHVLSLDALPSVIKAGNGAPGFGSCMNGKSGTNKVLEVPEGTNIVEIERIEPEIVLDYEGDKDDTETNKEDLAFANVFSEESNEKYNKNDDISYKSEHGRHSRTKPFNPLVYYPSNKTLESLTQNATIPRRYPVPEKPAYINLEVTSRTVERPRLLVPGGLGGIGNAALKSMKQPSPYYGTRGQPACTIKVKLEMKTIADFGLLGFPNAGKSSLLRAISAAKPKVAEYPFTTLTPHIGTIPLAPTLHTQSFNTEAEMYRGCFTVADIPGLIEGASENRGLGHSFLRHVIKSQVLVYVIDLSSGSGNLSVDIPPIAANIEPLSTIPSSPISALKLLRKELAAYDPELLNRRSIVVANKADLPDTEEQMAKLQAAVGEEFRDSPFKIPIVTPCSAKLGGGIERLIGIMSNMICQVRTAQEIEQLNKPPETDLDDQVKPELKQYNPKDSLDKLIKNL